MADRYWVGGTGTWAGTTTNWSATSGGASGASAPTAADNVIFDANSNTGTGAFTVTSSGAGTRACLNFDASAVDGLMTLAITGGTLAVSGSWVNHATNFAFSGTAILLFNATTTGNTINFNGVSRASGTLTFNGNGGGWTLSNDLSNNGGDVTLTLGAIDLNNYTLATLTFISNTNNTRSIAFGTSGKITCSAIGNVTVLNITPVSNFSYTGTSYIGLVGNATQDTRTIDVSTSTTAAQSLNVYVTNGSGSSRVDVGAGYLRTLDFTGCTANSTIPKATWVFYGSVILTSGITFVDSDASTVNITFKPTTGTFYFDTAVNNCNVPITIDGTGTLTLLNNLTIANGAKSSNYLTLTAGTFNANGYNVSAPYYTLTSGTLQMGSGTWTANDSGELTPWNNTGTTITAGTSTIAIPHTTTDTYTFIGGGKTYYNLGLTGTTGATGLTITGANTFNSITSSKTVSYTINLPSSTTTTVSTWGANGSSGKLVKINASTRGTRATLSMTSTVNYANIEDIDLASASTSTATNSNVINSNNWNVATTSKRWALLYSGSSWTSPSDWSTTGNEIHVIGGGGGGAGNIVTNIAGGAGGGGGGYAGITNMPLATSTAYTYTIGTGGAAGAGSTTSSTGGTGVTTQFSNTLSTAVPTYVGENKSSTTGSSLSITLPTGTQAGDLIIAVLTGASSGSCVWTLTSGWTSGFTSSNALAVYYRYAIAGEPSSYTFSMTGSTGGSGYLLSYRQASAHVFAGSYSSGTTLAAITTTVNNSIILAAARHGISGSTVTITTSGYTTIDSYSGTSPGMGSTVASKTLATAGSSGTATVAYGGAGSGGGILFSIRPIAINLQATGGIGGSASSTPTSVAGTGGTGSGGALNYSGGDGGAGATTGTLGRGPGAAGGAGGPNGTGGSGGAGIGSDISSGDAGGGGGGGNGGGTAGSIGTASGGTGGNNSLGTGGGSAAAGDGTLGGGGGGGSTSTAKGGNGGDGVDIIINGYGSGGGCGGGAGTGNVAGLYGGGGGGAGTNSSSATLRSGIDGATGAVFIGYTGTYIPSVVTNTGNMFFLFM